MKKNAISYIRFSSAPQGRGTSADRQETLINNWLATHPEYELSNLSEKDLGKSGFTGEHKKATSGLGQILAAVDEKKINKGDVILIEAIDRLGRLEPLEMLEIFKQIVSQGIEIITLHDNQVYSANRINDDSGALFNLVINIQAAHKYSKDLSKRLMAAYANKRKKARNGEKIKISTPFWLNTDGTLKAEESKAVKDCIDLYLKGYGPRKCLIDLKGKHPVLSTVHPTTFKKWFQNRAIIGIWENKENPIEGVFEPLIDKSTYYQLQSQLNHRKIKKSPEQKYALSGLVSCGECGCNFHFRRQKSKNNLILYGNCSNYLKRGTCSNKASWPYEVLEFIFQKTHKLALIHICQAKIIDQDNQQVTLKRKEKDEILKQLARLGDAVIKLPNYEPFLNQMVEDRERLKILEDEIKVLDKNLAENSIKIDKIIEMANEEMDSFDGDRDELRNLMQRAGFLIEVRGKEAMLGFIGSYIIKAGNTAPLLPFNIDDKRQNQPLSSFTLVRRSQQFKCYVVHKLDLPFDIKFSNFVVTMEHKPGSESYFGIGKNGVLSEAKTENDLIKKLLAIKELN